MNEIYGPTTKNIAVEGVEDDIVPVICLTLRLGGYNICYRNESSISELSGKPEAVKAVGQNIINSSPDLTVICNARGYIDVIKYHTQHPEIPLVVLTGGGPDLEQEVKQHTPYVLGVPLPAITNLTTEIQKIIG